MRFCSNCSNVCYLLGVMPERSPCGWSSSFSIGNMVAEYMAWFLLHVCCLTGHRNGLIRQCRVFGNCRLRYLESVCGFWVEGGVRVEVKNMNPCIIALVNVILGLIIFHRYVRICIRFTICALTPMHSTVRMPPERWSERKSS